MNLKRTVVAMLMAAPDQQRTVYGVFRAVVSVPLNGRWSWNVHRAEHVGSVTVRPGQACLSYQAMASPFATTDWPVFEHMNGGTR